MHCHFVVILCVSEKAQQIKKHLRGCLSSYWVFLSVKTLKSFYLNNYEAA